MKFRWMLGLCWLVLVPASAVEFSEQERALIALHGPWPQRAPVDSSNRVSGNPDAIRLGERLFFDHDLGGDTEASCATCHDPGLAFTDGRDTGRGKARLERNTTSLWNLGGNRWFGWGGESDSLWAQSIRPIVAADEMASTPEAVQALLMANERYHELYQSAFGNSPADDDSEQALVNAAKALAAYQETLLSPRTAFDEFRDALLNDDRDAMNAYPESAQRGLKLFVGEGRCNLCHFGPRFSNGEFGDIGISYFTVSGVDAGRFRGIKQVRSSPYNRLGEFNDGNAEQNAVFTRQVQLTQRNWGEFRVPGLRDVAVTAPYMHNGSLPTLRHVVLHYSNLDEERLHTDGEKILRPLNLDHQQVEDLIDFLESLSLQ